MEKALIINFNSYWQPRVHEAIAELEEAMKPKTCDGCKHASYDYECEEYYYSSDTYECRDCYRRGYKDNFKPKDNA